MLTPDAERWVRAVLGPGADSLLNELELGEGLPEQTGDPALLLPGAIERLMLAGLTLEEVQEWQRLINQEAAWFRQWRRNQTPEGRERERHKHEQREYRERKGDEFRQQHRDYMRDYRKRKQ